MSTQGWPGRAQSAQEGPCTGKLFWIWGAYAFGMLWMSRVLGEAGAPPVVVWAVAAVIGIGIALSMREF